MGAVWVCLGGEPGAGDGVKGVVWVLLPMWWGKGLGETGWGAYKPSVPPMDDAKTTPSTTQQMMIIIFFCRRKG